MSRGHQSRSARRWKESLNSYLAREWRLIRWHRSRPWTGSRGTSSLWKASMIPKLQSATSIKSALGCSRTSSLYRAALIRTASNRKESGSFWPYGSWLSSSSTLSRDGNQCCIEPRQLSASKMPGRATGLVWWSIRTRELRKDSFTAVSNQAHAYSKRPSVKTNSNSVKKTKIWPWIRLNQTTVFFVICSIKEISRNLAVSLWRSSSTFYAILFFSNPQWSTKHMQTLKSYRIPSPRSQLSNSLTLNYTISNPWQKF